MLKLIAVAMLGTVLGAQLSVMWGPCSRSDRVIILAAALIVLAVALSTGA